MNLQDLISLSQWGIMFFIIGIIFLPITTLIFQNFFDKGYIFSKIIGISFISYLVFLLGSIKILPFTFFSILLVIFLFLIINFFLLWRNKNILISFRKWKTFLSEELLFLIALAFWSYIRINQPDIHGLEKYMDFGFVNTILRSYYFPPADMWFPPFPINYYYFGHLVTALLTKLSQIGPEITYNLMLSTIFALTFTGGFSIGANLIYLKVKSQKSKLFENLNNENSLKIARLAAKRENFKLKIKVIVSGLLSAFLLSFAGNLQVIYAFFKPYTETPLPFWQLPFSLNNFPNSYWYPNATRFIQNTIHEFPIYSFVVSDLHGHVLDIPFVLLTIAVLFSLISKSEILASRRSGRNPKQYQNPNVNNSKSFGHSIFENLNLFRVSIFDIRILLLSFLLAVMYMTNVWDGVIYFLLASIILFYLKQYEKVIILFLAFIVFSLPFSLNFKPFASGIGILCAPDFLTNIGKIGPFLFEKDHCLRSPFWQLMILYGFFYFWIASFFIFIRKKLNATLRPRSGRERCTLDASDTFVLILIFLSTLLIIIPEFIYLKDIYPAHYRANTMFKLVYQSFIMLSLASAYIIFNLFLNLKSHFINSKFYWKFIKFILVFIGAIGLFAIMVYPYFAINSYYGNLKNSKGLDGISYLNNLYPNDYKAIIWLNKNIKGQPVILEAQGDSYTDYARISANTGLPTVVGWPVHEWLWRGTYDIPAPRIDDVSALYENEDLKISKYLIDKYNIEFIFIGDLERQKYTKLNEKKFEELGTLIFQMGQTKIYQTK